ncbi:rCG27506 [Rattus norvegicus]|uniref:RCG27506 n=1 Tax=Rattus norvegicus TaxID=10116 RepID=A6K7E0_RAT|nr:rCG27506 [Rattus norvegicus]
MVLWSQERGHMPSSNRHEHTWDSEGGRCFVFVIAYTCPTVLA